LPSCIAISEVDDHDEDGSTTAASFRRERAWTGLACGRVGDRTIEPSFNRSQTLTLRLSSYIAAHFVTWHLDDDLQAGRLCILRSNRASVNLDDAVGDRKT
jgi:hypothetical protein